MSVSVCAIGRNPVTYLTCTGVINSPVLEDLGALSLDGVGQFAGGWLLLTQCLDWGNWSLVLGNNGHCIRSSVLVLYVSDYLLWKLRCKTPSPQKKSIIHQAHTHTNNTHTYNNTHTDTHTNAHTHTRTHTHKTPSYLSLCYKCLIGLEFCGLCLTHRSFCPGYFVFSFQYYP